jgi:hypothetical protein
MIDLGIPDDQMGARDRARGSQIFCAFPGDRQGGTVSHAGQVTLDFGLMSPDLLKDGYDHKAQRACEEVSDGGPTKS